MDWMGKDFLGEGGGGRGREGGRWKGEGKGGTRRWNIGREGEGNEIGEKGEREREGI